MLAEEEAEKQKQLRKPELRMIECQSEEIPDKSQ